MKPGAWESGKGNHLCPESMESLPGTEAEDFRIDLLSSDANNNQMEITK